RASGGQSALLARSRQRASRRGHGARRAQGRRSRARRALRLRLRGVPRRGRRAHPRAQGADGPAARRGAGDLPRLVAILRRRLRPAPRGPRGAVPGHSAHGAAPGGARGNHPCREGDDPHPGAVLPRQGCRVARARDGHPRVPLRALVRRDGGRRVPAAFRGDGRRLAEGGRAMMLFEYPFAFAALALCLLLSATLSVFGHHVVRRGVLFVDLALAQAAALGSSAAVLMGWDAHEHPAANFAFALAFTLAGAALFAWFRRLRAPMEALIGIAYAGAMALSLLLLEHSATGAEEIREMLVGSILAVSPRELLAAAIVCAGAGVILWLTRRPVFRVTEDPRAARGAGLHLGLWDFLFYAAFGVVVT